MCKKSNDSLLFSFPDIVPYIFRRQCIWKTKGIFRFRGHELDNISQIPFIITAIITCLDSVIRLIEDIGKNSIMLIFFNVGSMLKCLNRSLLVLLRVQGFTLIIKWQFSYKSKQDWIYLSYILVSFFKCFIFFTDNLYFWMEISYTHWFSVYSSSFY